MSKTLSRSELALIDREGERIKNGLSNLVDDFPNHAKTITGMANWLSANKSTCQRMVETINKAVDGLQVIQSLPGPAGLRGFIDLAEKHKVNVKLVEEARAMVVRFENLIYEYSRSHSALKALIKASDKSKQNQGNKADQRKALFEATRMVTGEQMENLFFACILKENEQDHKFLQQYTLTFFDNCEKTETARPLVIPIGPCEQKLELEKPELISQDDELGSKLGNLSLIEELTSTSVVKSINEFTRGESSVIIPATSDQDNGINIAAMKNYPEEQLGPFYGGKKASCVSVQVRTPVKSLYMVCFLERSYAMRSVANAGIYSMNTQLATMITSPDALWYDRFHDEADLVLSSHDANFSEKLKYPMANELVDTLFTVTGCDRKEYAAYLVRVDYPIWSTAYRIYFQYAID